MIISFRDIESEKEIKHIFYSDDLTSIVNYLESLSYFNFISFDENNLPGIYEIKEKYFFIEHDLIIIKIQFKCLYPLDN